MTTKTYSYQTFPGQTIVRTNEVGGYSQRDLLQELAVNADGVVTTDESREDAFCGSIAGLNLRGCDLQFSDHGAGRKSVQIFRESELLADINL